MIPADAPRADDITPDVAVTLDGLLRERVRRLRHEILRSTSRA